MKSELFNLDSKTAVITGGSRGIGLAVAKGLAEYGADIAIISRTNVQLETAADQIQKETGQKVHTYCFDMGNIKEIEKLFDTIVADTKGVDILVNCAGTTIRGPSEDVDLETWNHVIEVNLTATFVMSQAFCRHRRNVNKTGRIINIGSLACHGGRPTIAAYASSKGGLLMLTKTLAVEWAKFNINVNAIGPGYITTELTEPLWTNEEFNKWVLSKTPLARWGKPEDLAGTAIMLASKAGDFITGQIIYVDGGWLALL